MSMVDCKGLELLKTDFEKLVVRPIDLTFLADFRTDAEAWKITFASKQDYVTCINYLLNYFMIPNSEGIVPPHKDYTWEYDTLRKNIKEPNIYPHTTIVYGYGCWANEYPIENFKKDVQNMLNGIKD